MKQNKYYSTFFLFVNIVQLIYSVCLSHIHNFYRIIYPKAVSLIYHLLVNDCGKEFERSHQIFIFCSPFENVLLFVEDSKTKKN